MVTKKKIGSVVIVSLVLVFVFIFIHTNFFQRIPQNGIQVYVKQNVEYLDVDALETKNVKGQFLTQVNGEKEFQTISGSGISLTEVLDGYVIHYKTVRIYSDLGYKVELSREALSKSENAYLFVENGKATFYLFEAAQADQIVPDVAKIEIDV